MKNIELARKIYSALKAREFDMDRAGFIECIAATLNAELPPPAAPLIPKGDWQSLVLAALTEGIGIPDSADPSTLRGPQDETSSGHSFATDLETIANFLKSYHPISADDLRRKARTIRAAIAAARSHPEPGSPELCRRVEGGEQ